MMSGSKIVGDGFIAKSFANFKNEKNILIFASGVSDSTSNKFEDFHRERKKIREFSNKYKNFKIIYFSTCSVLDKTRSKFKYQTHKIKIENFIKKKFKKYIIIRLPELIGKHNNNKKNLFNFLVNKINTEEKIETSENAFRNIIDIEDVKKTLKYILKNKITNKTINIANNNMYNVKYIIIPILEKLLNKKAKLKIVKKYNNPNFKIRLGISKKIFKEIKINFEKNYLEKKFKKYIK